MKARPCGDGIEIVYRPQLARRGMANVGWAVLALGFAWIWRSLLSRHGEVSVIVVVPIVAVAVAVVSGLSAVQNLCARVIIRAADGLLTVKHRPLPWFGPSHRLAAKRIRQLHGESVLEARSVSDDNPYAEAKTSIVGKLGLLADLGERYVVLVKGLRREEVLYLEQEIEAALHIDDEPVRGEIAQR